MAALPHHLLVLFLILVFPLWDRRETRRLKADPSAATRIRSYQKTVAWLWAATVLLVLTTPLPVLLAPPDVPWLAGSSVRVPMLLAMCASLLGGIAVPVILARRSAEARAGQVRQLAHVGFFLPASRSERRWFAAVCISAGVCEELIFRGFLIRYLEAVAPGLGLVGAIIAAALIFGVDHGYQGWRGVAQTGFMALLFTALFLLAGNLWVPMIAHALLDLRLLLILEPSDVATDAAAVR